MTTQELVPQNHESNYDLSPEAQAVAALAIAAEDVLKSRAERAAASTEEYPSISYSDEMTEEGDYVRRSEVKGSGLHETLTATTSNDQPGKVGYEMVKVYSGGTQITETWSSDGTEVSSKSRGMNGIEQDSVLTVEQIEGQVSSLEAQIPKDIVRPDTKKTARGVLGLLRRKR